MFRLAGANLGAKVSTLVKVSTRIFDKCGEMIIQKSLIFEKLVTDIHCFLIDFGQNHMICGYIATFFLNRTGFCCKSGRELGWQKLR